MSEYIAKAPIEPRDYRVVFLIQKELLAHICVRSSSLFSISLQRTYAGGQHPGSTLSFCYPSSSLAISGVNTTSLTPFTSI